MALRRCEDTYLAQVLLLLLASGVLLWAVVLSARAEETAGREWGLAQGHTVAQVALRLPKD